MSTSFSAVEFVQRVLALGPDFSLYGAALGEKKTVDSAFLQNLTDREIGILFAFIPQAHQAQLESVLPQNINASQDVPVEKALPSPAFNSGDDCEILPEEVLAQVGSSNVLEDGGGGGEDDDLFLDLDASSDDGLPATAAKKKKKTKRNRKKKTKAAPPPVGKNQEDINTIADLDTWLSKGASLTRKAALKTDLLVRAANVGHIEAVRALLKTPGIRVLLELPLGSNNARFSALHVAAFHGHSGIVRLLLANPDTQINRPIADGGFTSLFLASQEGRLEVVKILLGTGADREAATTAGSTSLYVASQRGHLEVAKILIHAGADTEAAMSVGSTSLYIASEFGHPEVVKILLDAGANKEATTQMGYTSLYVASECGHPEVVKVLLDAGAGKEAMTTAGCTSLYTAAKNGRLEVVKILLGAGADVEATTPLGLTSLYVASEHGHAKVIKVLLDAGADKEATCLRRTPPC